ncbi:MAG: class I SAM-dependent methyltransferase [Planctomycetota bacterium]
MPPPRLYDDLAWLWPHLSPPEQYAAEADTLDRLITQHLGPGPQRLLELGAGGGHTLVHLDARGRRGGRHHAVAVDRSDPMLAHCRRLIPGIETHVADMRDVRLDRTFDAVLIHDAIDYLLTPADVVTALATAHTHLRPGGLAFIAPTYTRETFVDGDVADDGTTTDDDELTYFTYVHDPDPTDDTFEMILLYLIRPHGLPSASSRRDVRVAEDRHTCGLFAHEQWLQMIQRAGMTPLPYLKEENAWSLYLARRPTTPTPVPGHQTLPAPSG